MTERYPFFRDEEEQTRAVIAEGAVDSDLNGTFVKPYAVLTQKRLYCKTKQGNFITSADQLRSAGPGSAPQMSALGWVTLVIAALITLIQAFTILSSTSPTPAMILLLVLTVASLVPSLVFSEKKPKLSLALLFINAVICLAMLFGLITGVLACIALVLYTKKEQNVPYEIRHTTGIFFFPVKDYAPEELAAFTAAVDKLKEESV